MQLLNPCTSALRPETSPDVLKPSASKGICEHPDTGLNLRTSAGIAPVSSKRPWFHTHKP